MIEQRHRSSLLWLVVVMVSIGGGLCARAASRVEPIEYLQYDARITGQQINHFVDDKQPVSVISGNFRLTVGDRQISGRKAVVWIKTHRSGKAIRHDITIYVEDDAQVIDKDGTSTTDKLMLVKLHVQGRLTMKATERDSDKPLKNQPLYRRAVQLRKDEARMVKQWRTRATKRGVTPPSDKPVVVRRSASEEKPKARVAAAEGKGPNDGVQRLEDLRAAGRRGKARKTAAKSTGRISDAKVEPEKKLSPEKAPALVVAPVQVSAPGGLTIVTEKEMRDGKATDLRMAIAKGKVVISQGSPKSSAYITLRANSAVIFVSARKKQKTDSRAPYAPPLVGMGGEAIEGVYLTGDVIIRRGERQMSAKSAYYDFVHEKAVILKPVFRTIQEQRNIPIYLRASRAKMLSPREIKFYDAVVSSSDFKTPTYSINAKQITFRDDTPYDKEGEKLGERHTSMEFKDGWFDLRGVHVLPMWSGRHSFQEGHSALRKASAGRYGDFGYGVETQWHLFRLLGLIPPKGLSAKLNFDVYEKGVIVGIDGDYQRREENRQYSGYFKIDGVYDRKGEDDFGNERKNIEAQHNRGRLLMRHKEYLPRDWQIQVEQSLMCDRNFLEEFFPDEYWAGKEQENLIYAKKQRDNWALTALMKVRLNDFLTQTESYPEVAGYLIGQSLLDDRLTYFGEARMGTKRYRMDDQTDPSVRSSAMARFDTRHEIDMPLQIATGMGPLNVVPYASGRFTYWSDTPTLDERMAMNNTPSEYNWQRERLPIPGDGDRGDNCRFYGQLGVRSNMSFWKIYDNVDSRLWDVHRLKHIITPEVVAYTSATNVSPQELYPLDPNVEQYIRENSGASFGISQRLQTKRGPEGNQRTVDWMRLNVVGGWFAHDEYGRRGNGKLYFSRPEYSRQRPFINVDYTWNISDSVAFLADMNYDLGDGQCDLVNAGISVKRDPRLSYYAGIRYNKELDSAVGTIGAEYKISKKYTVRLFEQYDFTYRGGVNNGTRVTIIRKLPRWNVGLTVMYDRRYSGDDDYGVMLTLWPEGVPEFKIDSGRMSLVNQSSDN
ncbi:MAG: LPS-assembly protein LptD [Phycisphaerae bacterium]|nr:LPS-assembly protein LptD [Phycisphaerae bacterium]